MLKHVIMYPQTSYIVLTITYRESLLNWSSGSVASRAVRLASGLPKNQRVVVSCRPPS